MVLKKASFACRCRSTCCVAMEPNELTTPSLISSRQMAGHRTARASACASVVFPEPGRPVTTISDGRIGSLALIESNALRDWHHLRAGCFKTNLRRCRQIRFDELLCRRSHGAGGVVAALGLTD